jgi:hypothetical protein
MGPMSAAHQEIWAPTTAEGPSGIITEAGTGGQRIGPMGGSHLRVVIAGPMAQVQTQATLVLDAVREQRGEGLWRHSPRAGMAEEEKQ